MIDFLSASANLPFVVSLCIMLVIAVLEATGLFFGMGISTLLDNLLPDLDIDVDTPEVTTPSFLTSLLDWLMVGRVPVLIIIVIFLTSFGITGLFTQALWMKITNLLLPSYIVIIPAIFISFPAVRFLAKGVSKIIPSEETRAVSEDSFIGKVATITLGKARKGEPAQARLHDEHGQTHYVMVVPDIEGEEFEAGDEVLIIERNGATFLVRRWIE